MRCQPYFATKTAAAMPSSKKAVAPRLMTTGSTVRRRASSISPWVPHGLPLSAQLIKPRRVRLAGGWGLARRGHLSLIGSVQPH